MRKHMPFIISALHMIIFPLISQGSSPLRYHTYVVVSVEARVEDIRLVHRAPTAPQEWRDRSPEWRGGDVQEVILRITKVETIELNRTGSLIRPGDSLRVINQYLEEKPPFAVGDSIRARVRLVLPEERYYPQDPRQQWWFFPPGEPKDISPPRLPFTGIQLVR